MMRPVLLGYLQNVGKQTDFNNLHMNLWKRRKCIEMQQITWHISTKFLTLLHWVTSNSCFIHYLYKIIIICGYTYGCRRARWGFRSAPLREGWGSHTGAAALTAGPSAAEPASYSLFN